jgi:hypothetical protein
LRFPLKSEAVQQRCATPRARSTLRSTASCLACGMSRSSFHTTARQQRSRCVLMPFVCSSPLAHTCIAAFNSSQPLPRRHHRHAHLKREGCL